MKPCILCPGHGEHMCFGGVYTQRVAYKGYGDEDCVMTCMRTIGPGIVDAASFEDCMFISTLPAIRADREYLRNVLGTRRHS